MMQQGDNQKNLLLAIVLSVGVLLAWQLFYAGPKMKAEQERVARQKETQVQQPGAPAQPGTGKSVATPGAPVAAPDTPAAIPGATPAPATLMTREMALTSSPRLAINTPSLLGS